MKFTVVWDIGHATDSFEAEGDEYAPAESIEDVYRGWIDNFEGSEDVWNDMINECSAYTIDETGEEHWLPDEYLDENVGWKPTEDMGEDEYNYYAERFGW